MSLPATSLPELLVCWAAVPGSNHLTLQTEHMFTIRDLWSISNKHCLRNSSSCDTTGRPLCWCWG